MKLATKRTNAPDGELLVVSQDLSQAVSAASVASTMQDALDRWDEAAPALAELYGALNAGTCDGAFDFVATEMDAPLPRAWQWLDGSVYPNHGQLMQKAFNLPPIEYDKPLMYQGMSHQFLAGHDEVPFFSEEGGIDFEAEFGIITGAVPMGTAASTAAQYMHLAVLINDWSLRAIAPAEMKTGFGWIQAKPACSIAPVAVTLDELEGLWVDNRITATMKVTRGGDVFGEVPGDEMDYGFDELVAHAAATRGLCAGTIIGSGTVSSKNYKVVGSCCIAERRAIEMIDQGAPKTDFLGFGEQVSIDVVDAKGQSNLFGSIDQRVVSV